VERLLTATVDPILAGYEAVDMGSIKL
jgi:hypothetical protein